MGMKYTQAYREMNRIYSEYRTGAKSHALCMWELASVTAQLDIQEEWEFTRFQGAYREVLALLAKPSA